MPTILAVVPDLFFRGRIDATAKHVGAVVRYAAAGALASRVAADKPSLVIVDLNAPGDPCAAIAKLRKGGHDVPVVGFLSHVQLDLRSRAEGAGATRVLPRSAFSEGLAEILRGGADAPPGPGEKS